MKPTRCTLSGLVLLLILSAAARYGGAAEPGLVTGVWKNITPADVTMTAENHVFCQGVTVDPAHPSTIYLCVCAYDIAQGGLYKRTDGGASWAKIGKLDEPLHLAIDPHDSRHLYCVDGVRGATLGFWESIDGGETWTMPSLRCARPSIATIRSSDSLPGWESWMFGIRSTCFRFMSGCRFGLASLAWRRRPWR